MMCQEFSNFAAQRFIVPTLRRKIGLLFGV